MAFVLLCATTPALRPLARPAASRELSPAFLARRELLVAAGAGLSLGLPNAAFAASKSNIKKRQPLQPELVLILRVQESTGQEAKLVSSGKNKDLQRLNIKRSTSMILENSDLQGRFVAASVYADPSKVSEATEYGNNAVEALVQIQEYFSAGGARLTSPGWVVGCDAALSRRPSPPRGSLTVPAASPVWQTSSR